MKFRVGGGECDSKEWYSDKQQGDGFEYWVVLSILNIHSCCGVDDGPEFCSRVSIVSPSLTGEARIRKSVLDVYDKDGISEQETVWRLFEYGYSVPMFSESDNNPLVLMTNAIKWAKKIPLEICDLLDQPVNAIGTSGWRWLTGEI